MTLKRQAKLKGQSLESRLTGLSIAGIGLNWTPPANEQDKARRLFVFLEDRRVLFNPFDIEVSNYAIQSIIQIRDRLTHDLEDISRSSPLGESISAMRAECRKLLNALQGNQSRHMGLGPIFMTYLGELRAIFGIRIARIAYSYDLEIGPELGTIIPLDPDEDPPPLDTE